MSQMGHQRPVDTPSSVAPCPLFPESGQIADSRPALCQIEDLSRDYQSGGTGNCCGPGMVRTLSIDLGIDVRCDFPRTRDRRYLEHATFVEFAGRGKSHLTVVERASS